MVRNHVDRFIMNALTVLIFSPDREMVRVHEPDAVPARLEVVD